MAHKLFRVGRKKQPAFPEATENEVTHAITEISNRLSAVERILLRLVDGLDK